MRTAARWMTAFGLLAGAAPLIMLVQFERLPTLGEAALIVLAGLLLVAAATAIRSYEPVRRLAARYPAPMVAPGHAAIPDDPEERRALAERYRARLDRLRRLRFAPSWFLPVLTLMQLPRALTKPWWWLVVVELGALASIWALEPFGLRRGLARLADPAATTGEHR